MAVEDRGLRHAWASWPRKPLFLQLSGSELLRRICQASPTAVSRRPWCHILEWLLLSCAPTLFSTLLCQFPMTRIPLGHCLQLLPFFGRQEPELPPSSARFRQVL